MPTPVKNITYLSGAVSIAPVVSPPKPLDLAALHGVLMRQAPPLWKPVRLSTVQPVARTILIPKSLYLRAMVILRMTPFWRRNPDAIGKGQQLP